LHGAGIVTLADLVRRSEADLATLKNFGRKTVRLLRERLDTPGLRFGMMRAPRRRSILSRGKTQREAFST